MQQYLLVAIGPLQMNSQLGYLHKFKPEAPPLTEELLTTDDSGGGESFLRVCSLVHRPSSSRWPHTHALMDLWINKKKKKNVCV